jgi:hypothetical protein
MKMNECFELQITEPETRAIAEAQRAIAACLARVAQAVDAAQPGGADGILAVVATGQGTIVAQMDVAPAGSVSIHLLHGDRTHNLGMLTYKPPARQQH